MTHYLIRRKHKHLLPILQTVLLKHIIPQMCVFHQWIRVLSINMCLCVNALAASGWQQQPVGLGVRHQRTRRLAAAPRLQQGSHAHEAPAEI